MNTNVNIIKIIQDIEQKLKIKFTESNITYYTDGATDAVVFSIANKYLIKTVDTNTQKTQSDFLKYYSNIPEFQKIIISNSTLKYICFEFIEGEKFNKSKIESKEAITQIYNIVKNYKKYESPNYGYLYEDNYTTWAEFLKSEVDYSTEAIQNLENCENLKNIAEQSIKNIQNFAPEKYLIHGDFGVHNFINHNGKIKVIDPMPLIGDYLYDFYYAIFSDADIFGNLDINYILKFFDKNIEYQKNMIKIVLYIRMCRAWKYNKNQFETYIDYLKKINW